MKKEQILKRTFSGILAFLLTISTFSSEPGEQNKETMDKFDIHQFPALPYPMMRLNLT
jgi:hypothetical protein